MSVINILLLFSYDFDNLPYHKSARKVQNPIRAPCPAARSLKACKARSSIQTLLINGHPAATKHLARLNLANAGETLALHIGQTSGSRISTQYTPPYPLTAPLNRLTITLE